MDSVDFVACKVETKHFTEAVFQKVKLINIYEHSQNDAEGSRWESEKPESFWQISMRR